jgi:hypothetical protein
MPALQSKHIFLIVFNVAKDRDIMFILIETGPVNLRGPVSNYLKIV